MAEYIEREALREVIVNLQFSKHLNKAASLNLMHRAVDNLPATDVVKVVRCKDCKHSRLPSKTTQKYGKPGTLTCKNAIGSSNNRNVNENDFCRYGERKEGVE